MQKVKVSIEKQIDERLYQYIVPYEGSYDEVIWVLDCMRKDLVDQKEEAVKKLEEQKQKEAING